MKRSCDGCECDQTPLGRGLNVVVNSRGVGLGLYCDDCQLKVAEAVRTIDRQFGAAFGEDGQYLASPRGAPLNPAPYLALVSF